MINMLDSESELDLTKNLKNKNDLYLNKKYDYSSILNSSTFNSKINKKDINLDSELNDFALYNLYNNNFMGYKKWTRSENSFENYNEIFEKYKINNIKKNREKLKYNFKDNSNIKKSVGTNTYKLGNNSLQANQK